MRTRKTFPAEIASLGATSRSIYRRSTQPSTLPRPPISSSFSASGRNLVHVGLENRFQPNPPFQALRMTILTRQPTAGHTRNVVKGISIYPTRNPISTLFEPPTFSHRGEKSHPSLPHSRVFRNSLVPSSTTTTTTTFLLSDRTQLHLHRKLGGAVLVDCISLVHRQRQRSNDEPIT